MNINRKGEEEIWRGGEVWKRKKTKGKCRAKYQKLQTPKGSNINNPG